MQPDRTAELTRLLRDRILILDGAMGTMIQQLKLSEDDFRGGMACGLHDHTHDLKGDNDLLVLTRPQAIREIHDAYFEAGADLTETNTFNATRIAQADYGLEHRVRDINRAAASIARESADRWTSRTPDRPRFVAGALGPTNRTASISPDVNDPGARNVTYDELVAAYREAAEGLIEGGADLLLVETVFDTLNAKAALVRHRASVRRRGRTAAADRVRNDHRCFGPHAVRPDADGFLAFGTACEAACSGLNCALGAALMRPYLEEIAHVADTFVSCYPNAGLPNPMSDTGYDETPEQTARLVKDFAKSGFVNIIGGCCGTTPAHVRAIADAVAGIPPHQRPVDREIEAAA